MTWRFNSQEIRSHSDLADDCTDIVYIIRFTDGTSYIGKKAVRSMRRLKPTKKQLAIRKNYKRMELKDLPFMNYTGSSDENIGKVIRYKEILHQCSNRKTSTYLETKLLFENDVLFNEWFSNKNISGSFYDNSLDGLIK